MLKRPTAVKLLKPGQNSRQAIARFEREVQLASRLTHPNTIDIYDFGRTPEGSFYYAMEYLPGITLDQLLGSAAGAAMLGRVHPAAGLPLAQEAHGIGLIHRDIKPQNIMLCERGGEYDFVKVLDFGLVKQLTESGHAPITPAFRSPARRVPRPGSLDRPSARCPRGHLCAGRGAVQPADQSAAL